MKQELLTIDEPLEITYLVFVPFSKAAKSLHQISLSLPKGAPYFFEHNIDVRLLETKAKVVKGARVEMSTQIFDSQIWLYECRYVLNATQKADIISRNHLIHKAIKQEIIETLHLGEKPIFEEYTIVKVQQKKLKPDEYIDQHSEMFAGLIRAVYEKTLDVREISHILMTRVRYSDEDLVLVDWNGAIIVTDDGDFASDVDLLKIGNYQLIRFRLLDELLEKKLRSLHQELTKPTYRWSVRGNKLLHEIVNARINILLTLEKLDTSILLIGDWYSSQLYRSIVDEFYLERWKRIVQEKLDNLKSIHETVSENLTLSWRRIIDQVTFVGWFVMMVGYFILFYFDFRSG